MLSKQKSKVKSQITYANVSRKVIKESCHCLPPVFHCFQWPCYDVPCSLVNNAIFLIFFFPRKTHLCLISTKQIEHCQCQSQFILSYFFQMAPDNYGERERERERFGIVQGEKIFFCKQVYYICLYISLLWYLNLSKTLCLLSQKKVVLYHLKQDNRIMAKKKRKCKMCL